MLSAPYLEPGTVDWKAYAFCVLEQVHLMLRRREVFAKNSPDLPYAEVPSISRMTCRALAEMIGLVVR